MAAINSLRTLLLVSMGITADKGSPWWNLIPESLRAIFLLTFVFVQFLVLAGVLCLAGLVVVGGRRARFTDAFIISFLGTILSTLFVMFIPYPFLPLLLSILVWLLLIKRFYETGWLGAIAVGLLTVIVFLAIAIVLALIFGIIEVILKLFLPSFSFIL